MTDRIDEVEYAPLDEIDPSLPHDAPLPDVATSDAAKPFPLEMWDQIKFDLDEEYLIDGVMPRQGVGLIYGQSQTFKSFVAFDLALRIAQGETWAGRKTERKPVDYLAAEGAAGIRKRRAGYISTGRAPAQGVDFALISAAPNLGTAAGDYERLVETIAAAGIAPGLVVIDTIAKAIGGADENGAGMAAFLVNAEKLAQHFRCFVLCIHHIGHEPINKDRPRGWSGLSAALDLQMLTERSPGDMAATVTLQKLKDEPSGVRFAVRMDRVVLGVSATGREVSTLVVAEVIETETPVVRTPNPPRVSKPLRLLLSVIKDALDEKGTAIQSFGAKGPTVRAIAERFVRPRYFARIAETAEPDEDEDKLRDRQRIGFKRAVEAALKSEALIAEDHQGERYFWFP